MIIEQLTLIGLFTIKGPVGFAQTDVRNKSLSAATFMKEMLSSTPFLVALPIGTMIFHVYCKKRFRAAFQFYPMVVRKQHRMLSICSSFRHVHK